MKSLPPYLQIPCLLTLSIWVLLLSPIHSQNNGSRNCLQEDMMVRWESIPPDQLFHWPVSITGLQNQERLYICRVLQSNGKYVSGKLRVGETTRCLVSNNGGVTSHETFERLRHPDYTFSWVPIPTSGTTAPKGAIVSGMSDSGNVQHVCRGFHKVAGRIDIIPGKYSASKRTCYIGVGGAEIAAKKGDVLVINALGRAMGVTQAPADMGRVVCPKCMSPSWKIHDSNY